MTTSFETRPLSDISSSQLEFYLHHLQSHNKNLDVATIGRGRKILRHRVIIPIVDLVRFGVHLIDLNNAQKKVKHPVPEYINRVLSEVSARSRTVTIVNDLIKPGDTHWQITYHIKYGMLHGKRSRILSRL